MGITEGAGGASTPVFVPKSRLSTPNVTPKHQPEGVETRLIHRGHGRELDVEVIGVPGEAKGWSAGRGVRTGPPVTTTSPRIRQSSPKLFMMGRGRIPPASTPASTASSPGSHRSMPTPILGGFQTPPLAAMHQGGSYGKRLKSDPQAVSEILLMQLEEALEVYPLFHNELGKQSTKTQMNLTLDWAKKEKPPRLVATVESCWAQGLFKVVKSGRGGVKQLPKKEAKFNPLADAFTPPTKPLARPSPNLDPLAAEFVPPSVTNKRLAKKKKTLDPKASSWTPTPPTNPAQSALSATATEWTPRSKPLQPPPAGFEPLTAGPATFASTPARHSLHFTPMETGGSFEMYGADQTE